MPDDFNNFLNGLVEAIEVSLVRDGLHSGTASVADHLSLLLVFSNVVEEVGLDVGDGLLEGALVNGLFCLCGATLFVSQTLGNIESLLSSELSVENGCHYLVLLGL